MKIALSAAFQGFFVEISASEKYFSDCGKWPFHTPPIHTPTKCRPINVNMELLACSILPEAFPHSGSTLQPPPHVIYPIALLFEQSHKGFFAKGFLSRALRQDVMMTLYGAS